MGFNERLSLANKTVVPVSSFLTDIGFEVHDMGYENYFTDNLRNKISRIHDNPTISLLRFLPDKFIFFEKEGTQKYFWLECKTCERQIKWQSRVDWLKKKSGDDTLSIYNIGIVNTLAVETYKKYCSMGADILLLIHSCFYLRNGVMKPFLILPVNQLQIIHQGTVKSHEGNGSRAPFTNINLDHFVEFDEYLKNNFDVDSNKLQTAYGNLITAVSRS